MLKCTKIIFREYNLSSFIILYARSNILKELLVSMNQIQKAKFLFSFLFLSFHCFIYAQKQSEVNWAVSTNAVISGINYYAPIEEFLDYFHISPLAGYSAVIDMSVPFKKGKDFSWYANAGYLKSGFKGRHYIATIEENENMPSTHPFRHEEWSNINFNHLTLGGFIGYKRGKINLQLGGKILYLIRTTESQQTVFLTQESSANIFGESKRFPVKGFRKWDIGPQINIEILFWKNLFFNTSFYYGSNEVTGTPSTRFLEKRVYTEIGLKYYFCLLP